uniref:SUZ-C domain-containing protein n=1 Tax=Timema poppense TaxID=170557 RepID=A0A7R9H516_TIMPO|nr:unnamed protein product [Timema poppensis]
MVQSIRACHVKTPVWLVSSFVGLSLGSTSDWMLHTPGGGPLESLCPCLPSKLCPRIFGKTREDILLFGHLPICMDSRDVRCCGASVDVENQEPMASAFQDNYMQDKDIGKMKNETLLKTIDVKDYLTESGAVALDTDAKQRFMGTQDNESTLNDIPHQSNNVNNHNDKTLEKSYSLEKTDMRLAMNGRVKDMGQEDKKNRDTSDSFSSSAKFEDLFAPDFSVSSLAVVGAMTFQGRSNKPMDQSVVKLEVERLRGHVVCEPVLDQDAKERRGWIMHESRGNTYFLFFGQADVTSDTQLFAGDEVTFQRATYKLGEQGAVELRLVQRAFTCLGIVSCIKDSLGYIERADLPKEVVFYFSDMRLVADSLKVEEEVGFTVKGRNGREKATGITRVEPGTVIIEDVCVKSLRGKVVQPLERAPPGTTMETFIPGKIRYTSSNERHTEVMFGPRGQQKCYTLFPGDSVEFSLAVDRRNQQQRAVNISLCLESLITSHEPREKGIVTLLKGMYGFIRCKDRAHNVYFSLDEILEPKREVYINDEVEYTPMESNSEYRHNALRVRHLNPDKQLSTHYGYIAAFQDEYGYIETSGLQQEVFYHISQFRGTVIHPEIGSEVEYKVYSRLASKPMINAESVRLVPQGSIKQPAVKDQVFQGVVIRPIKHLASKQVDKKCRAALVKPSTPRFNGTVESIGDSSGIIVCSLTVLWRRLYFHCYDVKDSVSLASGDKVEFRLKWNYSTRKPNACAIVKCQANCDNDLDLPKNTRFINNETKKGPSRDDTCSDENVTKSLEDGNCLISSASNMRSSQEVKQLIDEICKEYLLTSNKTNYRSENFPSTANMASMNFNRLALVPVKEQVKRLQITDFKNQHEMKSDYKNNENNSTNIHLVSIRSSSECSHDTKDKKNSSRAPNNDKCQSFDHVGCRNMANPQSDHCSASENNRSKTNNHVVVKHFGGGTGFNKGGFISCMLGTRSSSEEFSLKMGLLRQPRGPDGTKGFRKGWRQPRVPGMMPLRDIRQLVNNPN